MRSDIATVDFEGLKTDLKPYSIVVLLLDTSLAINRYFDVKFEFNHGFSAFNETSENWRILDPDIEDSHILPLGTLFKVRIQPTYTEIIFTRSAIASEDYSIDNQFRLNLNLKSILISKLILVLLAELPRKLKMESDFQMQQIQDVSEWWKMVVNIDKAKKRKLKVSA